MPNQTKEDTQPAPDSTSNSRSGATPTEASQYVRFALSQLAGRNGHHEFEQLCFQLARKRIYSNVIPATGPVSAGGDQGADFETYQVGEVMPVGTKSPFFGRVSREKVVFACSIEKNVQKKIKEDLSAAAEFPERVERLVFLTNGDVPVGRRHKLQEFARQTHGISLEVFDSRAISEWLTEPELFWIAQQYLSISSDFALAVPKSRQEWYEEAVTASVDPARATESDFYKLKDAVRFATHDDVYRSDLPGLLSKLRLFREHRSIQIKRKAFYEEFVASLRGLENVQGLEAGLERYVSDVALSDDPSQLEDGAVLISYSVGAKARGLLEVEMSSVVRWRKSLLAQIESLLSKSGVGPGRRCSLMSTQGFLLLFEWIDDGISERSKARYATSAIDVWRRMLKEVRAAPLFPLERFGKLLSMLAAEMEYGEAFSRLVRDTDKLLAARFGKHKIAEQAFARAQSYYEAGRTLEAIDELHKARIASFTEERARDSVQFCIFLAKMYSQIGLHFAAKWYGLGAAFAALKLDDEGLRAQAYRGLIEAASSDHACGASMEFFLTANAFFWVSSEFSMAGTERTKQTEWARIDFYSLLLTRAASYLDEPLYRYLKDTVLKAFGADEIYDESASRLDEIFGPRGFQGIVEKATLEGILPPFSDAGPLRRVGWQQLGVKWFVEWSNDYHAAQAAESFCATLQILLEDLRRIELSLLPADVSLSIDLHDGNLEIKDLSDNKRISWIVHLPRTPGANGGMTERSGIVQGVAASVLKTLSAMPHERFMELYEQRAKAGLLGKLLPYSEYERLFSEFYSEQHFTEHYEHSRGIAVSLPEAAAKTAPGLAGPAGLHPSYSKKESERLIRRRYDILPGQLKYTLPQLEKDESFRLAVRELREQGWKDWHILQAAASVRLNYVINSTVPRHLGINEFKKAGKHVYERAEEISDPAPPAEMFTAVELKQALIFTQVSTLNGLGFECSQRTPNFEGLDRFLRRFNYWLDDVAHPKLLPD